MKALKEIRYNRITVYVESTSDTKIEFPGMESKNSTVANRIFRFALLR